MMQLTSKQKRITAICVGILLGLSVIGGIAAGIYFGIQHNRFSGHVYDAATNTPLEGVCVTNGRDVVRTDANGFYQMNGWLKNRFVTLTIPSGYWTENYYLNMTSAREGYDFYLEPVEEDQTNHTFLQISDTEVGAKGVGPWIDNVKEQIQKTDPAFLIHTGDICYEDGLKSHINGMNTETMGVPVRYIIGNHDYVSWGGYGEALFESIYGPVCYSFDIGNIHYVVTPIVTGDVRARYSHSDIWRWLANDLAQVSPEKKVVLFNHDYSPDENGFVLKYGLNELDLKDHNLLAWIFGHLHYNYLNRTEDGIFNICTSRPDTGGIDSAPSVVRQIDIEGTQLVRSEMLYFDCEPAQPDAGVAQWTTKLDGHGEYSSPVVSGDRVYVGTVNDGYPKQCGIYALDAKSGNVLWQYATVNSIRNTIIVDGGRVYAQDCEGYVYCLNADNGQEIWKIHSGIERPRNTSLGIALADGKLYCGGPHLLSCINTADGATLWTQKNPRACNSPARVVVQGNAVILSSHWDTLIAYDRVSGKKLWANEKNGLRYRTTTPGMWGNSLLVAAQSKVFVLDPANGKIVSEHEYDDYTFDTATSPLVIGSTAYFATANAGVVAISLDTWQVQWNYKTGESLVFTSPYSGKGACSVESNILSIDNELVFGASDGNLYRMNADGKVVQSYAVRSAILNTPAVYGNGCIVFDFSGNLSYIAF